MRLITAPRLMLALAALFAVLPMFADPYFLYVGNLTFIYVILALSLDLLLGQTGLLVFVNGALFGVGAYATAILRTGYGLPYGLALPAGTVATLIIGVCVALPALRLATLYLALATIAFAQTTQWVFLHWDSLTGGPSGIKVAPVEYGLPVSAGVAHYYACLLAAMVVVVLVGNLLRSRIGRAFVAVRESEAGAESLAIDITRTKTLAYAISAGMAGLAGGLFAPLLGLVVPESYDMFQVVLQFAMVVVGGLGSVAGAVLGAVLLVWLQEGLRAFKDLQEVAFGGLILLTVMFLPSGITGLLRRVLPSWREPMHRENKHP